ASVFSVPGLGNTAFSVKHVRDRARSFSHRPYRRTGPSRIVRMDLPFPVTLNRHLDRARAHTLAWLAEMGLLDEQPGVPGSGVWNRQKAADYDLALCAAGIAPD